MHTASPEPWTSTSRPIPLGNDTDGNPVYLKDIWPSTQEIEETIKSSIDQDMFRKSYATIFAGDSRWQNLETPKGDTFEWDENSTYVRKPPYFDGMTMDPAPVKDIKGARVLALLGDSVTTDHISPAGPIKVGTPAAQYLDSMASSVRITTRSARVAVTTRS